MKYTVKGQVLSVIATHAKAAVLFFIVWLLALSITGTKIGGLIYSVISAIFYFFMMYNAGYSIVKDDKKSYTELTSDKKKGLLLPIGLLVLNIVLVVLYKAAWTFASDGSGLTNWWALACNALALFWFSPYINILGMDKGALAVYGYAIICLLHILAFYLGYFAGYNDFDISTKFRFLMYEKKK